MNFPKTKSDFARNVMILMSGNVIAQVISLLLALILTRLYSPEEFGVYALFFSVISILTVVATGRYETAIMLPSSEKTATSIVYISIFISLILSLITLIVVIIFDKNINDWFGVQVAYLIPVLMLLIGVSQSLRVWLNRKKKYRQMAFNRIEQSYISGGLQLFLGFSNYGSIGLIIGQFLGEVVAAFRLGLYTKNSGYSLKKPNLRSIASLRKYFYLVKFGVPASLSSRAAQESLTVLIGYFMSSGIVGFISLINRVVSVPSSVLGTSLGEVFYQNITETKKNKSYPLVKSFMLKLVCFSIPVYFIFYLILDFSFVWIFGEKWQDALEFVPYLTIVAAFSFIFSPISILFNYYEIQGWNLIWQFLWLISNILVFWFYGVFDLTIDEVFLLYTVKQVLLYIIGLVSFFFYAQKIYEK